MNPSTDNLWGKAYQILGDWPNDKGTLVELLRELDSCLRQNHEHSLLRGYLAYHFPCDATRGIAVEAELKQALVENPKDTTAHLYLAHYYYDSQQFEDALRHLDLLDRHKFIQAGQIWRSLKVDELKLCARLFLRPSSVTSAELIQFLEELRRSGAENAAVPIELVDALLSSKQALAKAWTMPQLITVAAVLRLAIDEIASPETLREKTNLLIA